MCILKDYVHIYVITGTLECVCFMFGVHQFGTHRAAAAVVAFMLFYCCVTLQSISDMLVHKDLGIAFHVFRVCPSLGVFVCIVQQSIRTNFRIPVFK